MKVTGFKLNRAGVKELLRSSEMQRVIKGYASNVAIRAGEGYEEETKVGQNRAYANIYPESYNAKRDNYKNNTLLKSLR